MSTHPESVPKNVPESTLESLPQNTSIDSRPAAEADAFELAPNWKLIWWRFRKHKLAMLSAVLLGVIGLVALFPDFFSTQEPHKSSARESFMPVQGIHWIKPDGSFGPHALAVVGKRNPTTLKMEWQTDGQKIIPIDFLVSGYQYSVFGLFNTRLHLFGPAADADGTASGSRIHLLGTDRLGRDQWSRLMHGTRVSLSIGLVAVMFSIVLGILLGGISGYFGGWIDMVIQRIIEILQSLPPIPIWMALTAALPRDWSVEQTYFAITIILSLIGWTTLGREVRGRFLSLREEDFVMSAELIGCSKMRIIFRHMLPTFTSHIIATSTLAIPVMIINETFLSFLGLGLRPPAISWGVLLQEAQNLQSVALAPWLLLPGLAVIITVLALNILGDGLRDAADPYN
jgi:peptide/nickel transport system permease protein